VKQRFRTPARYSRYLPWPFQSLVPASDEPPDEFESPLPVAGEPSGEFECPLSFVLGARVPGEGEP
jgi:hypothetical protein